MNTPLREFCVIILESILPTFSEGIARVFNRDEASRLSLYATPPLAGSSSSPEFRDRFCLQNFILSHWPALATLYFLFLNIRILSCHIAETYHTAIPVRQYESRHLFFHFIFNKAIADIRTTYLSWSLSEGLSSYVIQQCSRRFD
jgi:hypothetical protein